MVASELSTLDLSSAVDKALNDLFRAKLSLLVLGFEVYQLTNRIRKIVESKYLEVEFLNIEHTHFLRFRNLSS